jgi:hypothetical protein
MVGIKTDGTDSTTALNNLLSYASTNGYNIVVFPDGEVILSSSVTVPSGITLQGNLRYEATKGTRFKWMGGNNTSVFIINNDNTLKDIFAYNGNLATGVMCFDLWGSNTGRGPSGNLFINVQAKKFDTGFGFSNGYYNTLLHCTVSYCNTGLKFGNESNCLEFLSCQIQACGTGVLLTNNSKVVRFSNLSIEGCTVVGVDLTNGKTASLAQDWEFTATYFEGNYQTAFIGGNVVLFQNTYINADWIGTSDAPYASNPTAGCIEIYGGSELSIDGVNVAGAIPADKLIAFTGTLSSLAVNGLTLKRIQKTGSWLSTFIKNNLTLILNGKINKSSDITIRESEKFDASKSWFTSLLPLGFGFDINAKVLVGAYLFVDTQISFTTSFIVNMGTGGGYNQYIAQTFSTSPLAKGSYPLTLLSNPSLTPITQNYYMNNAAVTSGMYKVILIMSEQ